MFFDSIHAAYRSLRATPKYSVFAILSLAIGGGANLSLFTFFNAVLLKPLSFPNPDNLVLVTQWNAKRQTPEFLTTGVSPIQFLRWRDEAKSFESMGLTHIANTASLTGAGAPETLGVLAVSAELFHTLQRPPQLGRPFRRAEEKRGMPAVAILTESLWKRRFSGDPNVIGRKIVLGGVPHEVVGVAPPDLRLFRGRQLHPGLEFPERIDVYVPLRFNEADEQGGANPGFTLIARLNRGVTAEAARAELDTTQPSFRYTTDPFVEAHTIVQPLHTAVTGGVQKEMVLLLLSAVLILLIACVNVANLNLVRTTGRARELAIRVAMGASTRTLVGYSLAESALLTAAGLTGGWLLSMWVTATLTSWAPATIPRLDEVTPDANVLMFAAATFVVITLLLSILPAWRASGTNPQQSLAISTRGNTDGSRGNSIRKALVSAEVALGSGLLIVSGLLLTSLHNVINVQPGFDTSNVLSIRISLPDVRYRSPEAQDKFSRNLREAVNQVHGVLNTAVVSVLPLTFERNVAGAIKEGSQIPEHLAQWLMVSGDYFDVMKIRLRAGRLFQDTNEADPVVVVSESIAKTLWPGQDAIGRKVAHMGRPERFYRVIGVVADVRSGGLDRRPSSVIYRHFAERPRPEFSLVVSTRVPPDSLASVARGVVSRMDPEVAVMEVRTMSGVVRESVEQRRFRAVLVCAFAAVALLLAAIGIYGVVAYTLVQRYKEIGVRIALGADSRDVRRLLMRHGMTPVLTGLMVGVLTTAAVARVLSSLLFQVSALEPVAFIGAPLLLGIVGALPCWLTAIQAGKTDPAVALRLD
jgi:putative ABC transport system permease protein